MAQDDNRESTEVTTTRAAGTSSETYPFVTGTNYTNTENREYVTSPLSDPDVDADEDVTDEVRAARAEVENTRAELSGTIDALKEKLSPANLVAEAKEATVGAAQSAVGDAVDSAKTVAHNAVDSAKEVVHNVVDTAKDVAASAASAVSGVASNVAASISGAVDTAKTAVTGAAHDAGHIAKNATHSVKGASYSVGHTAKGAGATIVETIRLNPIPAAITGIGLGWLIMSIRRQNDTSTSYGTYGGGSSADRFASTTDEYGTNNFATSGYTAPGSEVPSRIDAAKDKLVDVKDSVTHKASDIAHTVGDKASGLASSVSDKASGLASSASGLAQTVGTKASDIAHTVGDKASAFGGQAKDTAQSAVSATGDYITGNPLAAGAIAVLLGVGVGLLIPATEKENQLLGETRDRLKDQAAEQLHQVADKVTNVAQTAFDSAKQTVKDEAQNQGLTGSAA
ncbi:MAG: DUF3618 domain-containing protein [Armatimonadota bacterium]